nr:MAG TPA: Protein of unknown function (DUF1071) [Caudoviricetes sp.]
MENAKDRFNTLYNVDVSAKLGKKMGLSYLSWADAWAELKKHYPEAEYKIYTRKVNTKIEKKYQLEGGDVKTVEETYENDIPYFSDGRTCFVKVGVIIDGHEEIEIFPVRTNKNTSISVDRVTMVDVNKALQRAFVKACARHGLGLYVYAGEDLPEDKRINLKDIIKEAERSANTDIDSKEFERERNFIISYISALGDNVDSNLYNYIQSLFPNRRLSTLTFAEDKVGVGKLFYIVSKLSE